MTTYAPKVLAGLTTALALAACGGGSTGGGPSHTTGIPLPSEVSALPATGAAAASHSLSLSLPVGDYAAAVTTRVVSERALSQFDILNTIFGAVAQTHYAEAGNVDTGPYAAMISWLDENDDRAAKRIVRWVVDSKMVTVGGRPENRLQVWFFDVQDGEPRIIKVQLDIYEPPTRNEAGGYSDYGVWTLNARLADDPPQWFVARAERVTVDGQALSRVMIHEADKDGTVTKGILLRADGMGYGRVSYPDWNRCTTQPCTPPQVEVAYVYDADHVALRKDGATLWKSRTDTVDVVRRYGLYDATTGADVAKTFPFGFPIRATIDGVQQYGYYGSWQGRHQIWAGGGAVPAGLTVHRGDTDSNAVAYVTSAAFRGVLTERTYAASSLDEITGVTLNTWIGQGARVTFDGTSWTACLDPQWSGVQSPTCSSQFQVSDLAAFFGAQAPEQVNINRWSQQAGSQNLVYDGGQLWVATPGPNGSWTKTDVAWTPQAGDEAWVWRNGPVWLVYDGGWRQKTVVAYDAQRNQPTFGGSDTAYDFLEDRDYNLNDNGVNYIVRRTGDTYDVQVERQTVPNPVNAALMIPDAMRFQRGCCGDTSSVFRFVTAPGEDYLQLVYETVGSQDQAAGRAAGDVVAEGIWNLLVVGSTARRFTWDYQTGGDGWAVQQYLLRDGAYQVLHDPLRFAPISLTTHAGQGRSCALQFDGSWLGGVPDVQQLLRDNDGDMTAEIAAQVITVGDGQVVTEATGAGRQYVFKPLQVAQFLMPVADPGGLHLAPADALVLDDVPAFADPHLGTAPSVPIRYSEGLPVP